MLLAWGLRQRSRRAWKQAVSCPRLKSMLWALSTCASVATTLLSYRPRSHKEMSDRLSRRGFDLKVVAETLARLEEVGLVDDAAFARMWKDNRQTFHPRSGRLVGIELRRKGVAAELASQMAAEVDDAATAYQTALKKAGTLDTADLQTFRRRLGDYLRRRGFSYEVVNLTVNRLWQEKHPSPEGPRID